jgi:hypothetical protein
MVRLEVVRDGKKQNFKASVFYNEKHSRKEKASYWNIIDHDKTKLAQLLIDLHLEGFPIIEAFKIFQERINNRDWLGF